MRLSGHFKNYKHYFQKLLWSIFKKHQFGNSYIYEITYNAVSRHNIIHLGEEPSGIDTNLNRMGEGPGGYETTLVKIANMGLGHVF